MERALSFGRLDILETPAGRADYRAAGSGGDKGAGEKPDMPFGRLALRPALSPGFPPGETVTDGNWPHRTHRPDQRPPVTASACLVESGIRRASVADAAAGWRDGLLAPCTPASDGRLRRKGQARPAVFYPRRGTPPSSDPPRPALRGGRVTDGDGTSMEEVLGAGISFFARWIIVGVRQTGETP